jgi:hypothetical protein
MHVSWPRLPPRRVTSMERGKSDGNCENEDPASLRVQIAAQESIPPNRFTISSELHPRNPEKAADPAYR